MVGGEPWAPVSLTVLPAEDFSRLAPVCRFFEVDFGRVLVAAVTGGLCAVSLDGGGGEAVADFCARFPGAELRFGDCRVLDAVARLLASPSCFARGGEVLPVVVCGSGFQVAVWQAVLRIPFGATASYSMSPWPSGVPGLRAPSVRRWGATRCRSSCRATAWSARLGDWVVSVGVPRPRGDCWPGRPVSPVVASINACGRTPRRRK